MGNLVDAVLHPIDTIKNNFSEEAMSYEKDQNAIKETESTAEELCNVDGLVNTDVDEELAKISYYSSMPGIEVDSALSTYLNVQKNAIETSKNTLTGSLKQQYITQANAIQTQQKYLKDEIKNIKGCKKSEKSARQNIQNDCTPLAYLLSYGKGKSSKEALSKAKEALKKAKSKKFALQLKINGLKEKLAGIKSKISEERGKISKANQQMTLYKNLTKSQFALADKYIALGMIAKQTGLADGTNPANKEFLKQLPQAQGKLILDVLSAFPSGKEEKPQTDIIISFEGKGLITEPSDKILKVQAATRALEELQLNFHKSQLLDSASQDGIPLLPNVNRRRLEDKEKYIDTRMATAKGELPKYIMDQINNRQNQSNNRHDAHDDDDWTH